MSRFSRRNFLQGLGATTGLLPFLGTDLARSATHPTRFLIVGSPNGMFPKTFWPSGSGTDLTQHTFPEATRPLEKFASKLTFIAGLQNQAHIDDWQSKGGDLGHSAFKYAVTGRKRPSHSLDVRLSGHIARTDKSKFPILNLGVQASRQRKPFELSITQDGGSSPLDENPFNVYNRLFGDLGVSDDQLNKMRFENKSILDTVKSSVDRFAGRLGSEDRARIEQHAAAIRALEQSLDVVVSCQKPAQPQDIDLNSTANYPQLMDAMFHNVAMAFACGLTRVVSLQLDNHGGNRALPWLGGDFTKPPDCALIKCNTSTDDGMMTHHGIAHGDKRSEEGGRYKTAVDKWYMGQLAKLLDMLDSVREGNGTMLDNTCVLYTSNMSHGDHTFTFPPYLLAGGAGGALRTGQMLRFGKFQDYEDSGYDSRHLRGSYSLDSVDDTQTVPSNGVMLAIANAFGMDMQTFGDPEYGGELPGIRA